MLEADELLLDVLDDAVELLVVPCSALWTAAVSWVLTRSRAVWLAMLARPLRLGRHGVGHHGDQPSRFAPATGSGLATWLQ